MFGKALLLLTTIALYALFLVQPINLSTADLGRHIQNGEIFLTTGTIPQGNFYSYTFPDSDFVNHHWGTGVLFALAHRIGGFDALSILFLLFSIGTLVLAFDTARRLSSFRVALLTTVFFLPLVTSRTEIRPEVFSYFLTLLFLWMLVRFRAGDLSKNWILFGLPALELIWVNLHIYFPFGILLIGIFLAESLIGAIRRYEVNRPTPTTFQHSAECWNVVGRKKSLEQTYILGIAIVASLSITLINPLGLTGAFYPFHIFSDYGYPLLENQPAWKIESLIPYPPALSFKIAFGGLVLSWILAAIRVIRHEAMLPVAPLLLTLGFGWLGWSAVRNFAHFGYVMLPVVARNIDIFFTSPLLPRAGFKRTPEINRRKSSFITGILALCIFLGVILSNPTYFQSKNSMGVGLAPGVNSAAQFFKTNGIKGPLFNNYDVGGYLIYHLYPEERVFVDNRPEAYPAEFFTQTYIPMQERNEKWYQVSAEYRFNTIFFNRRDLTPWGQQFLVSRVQDPEWAPVFADGYHTIFLRRGGPNQSVIDQFEIPQSAFSITER